jgi:hypothetical protein
MSITFLRGGRVIDPATGTETVADVLVRGDRVAGVSPVPFHEPEVTVIDVTGLVVGPGFVDLHCHAQSIAGQRLQAFDGVTTGLELEAGLMPVDRAYADAAAAGRVLNYGFSASWAQARGQVLAGIVPTACATSTAPPGGTSTGCWRRSRRRAPRGHGSPSRSTSVGAFFLAPDRLRAAGLAPSSIVMLGTGERIADERRLNEVRALDPAATCLPEFLDERDETDRELLRRALAFPDSIVASDAMPVEWPDHRADTRQWPLPAGASTHPRTAGTFARSLRLMVREHALWDWTEAFRRCSYLPARVLDDIAPAMRTKGRIEPGADADLVAIDPGAITDNASAADPVRPSSGVPHLLVGGTFVIRDGRLDPDVFPGRAVRGELS